MQKMILVFVMTMFVGAVFPTDGAGQAPCAPGMPGCSSAPQSLPPDIELPDQRALVPPRCKLPGIWEDYFQADIIINESRTGTFRLPYCGSSHNFRITQTGDTFTLKASWGGDKECIGFTEYMTFGTDCDMASGTFINSDGGSGTDTWFRDGISLKRLDLMTIQAIGSPDNGGTFLWNPVRQSGNYPPTIDFAPGHTEFDNPNEVTLKNPAGPGAPTPGGLTKVYGKYFWSTLNGDYNSAKYILVPTFGMSCYYNSLEGDWGIPPDACVRAKIQGVWYDGAYDEAYMEKNFKYSGVFCKSFIQSVRVEGGGRKSDGTIIGYDKTRRAIYEPNPQQIPGSDGTPLVGGQTVARDKKVIGKNVHVTLDQFGEVLANDTGSAIKGYRLDLYMGEGKAVCQSPPIANNPIVVGGCDAEQKIGGKVTCPPVY